MRSSKDVLIAMDILALVGHKVTKSEVRIWTNERYDKIVDWASKVYLDASDNPVRVPEKPTFRSKEITT